MRRAPGFVVAVAVVVVALATGASAQSGGSVELVAQSAWIDDGGVFDIQVRVAGASRDSTVHLLVHPPIESRGELLRGIADDSEPVLELGPLPLSELQATSNEILALQIAIVGPRTAEPGSDLDPGDDPLPILRTDGTTGVYPIEVRLESGAGAVVDRFTTHLLELPRGRVLPPLQISMIVPIDSEPRLQPDGSPAPGIDTGPIETLVTAMEIQPESALTFDVTAEALRAIVDAGDDSALLERLAEVTGPERILPGAPIRVDDQAWLDAELDEELAFLYDEADRTFENTLGFRPDRDVALLDPTLDSGGLDFLTGVGVKGVIVRTDALARDLVDPFDSSMNRQFLVPTEEGTTMPAVEADTDLLTYLDGTEGSPVIRANRLLAELTAIALEQPDVRRSVTIVAPEDWDPDPQFLNVVLAGVERIPVLEGATPKTAIAATEFAPSGGEGSISPPLRRELTPIDATPLGAFRTEYNQAIAAVQSWQTVLATDPGSTDQLMDLIRIAADERLDATDRAAYIDTVYRLIDEQKRSALVTPDSETITLTGRETTLPVIVDNTLAVPVSVVLLFDSAKLRFPEGAEVPVTLDPGSNRIEVPVEVLASGDSPIRVQILSPDRAVLLDSSEVVVRSFSFPGVGIAIGIGSIIVLLLWWLRQYRDPRGTLEPAPTA